MRKLTINDMRGLLDELLDHSAVLQEDVAKKSDKQLLDTDVCREYDFDSLDLELLILTVDIRFGIAIDSSDMRKSAFYEEPTVRNFLKLCKDYGK